MTSTWGPGSPHKDMRTWIDELDSAGELIRIDKRVDQIGRASRRERV